MTLSPIGHESYVSPYGSEALNNYNAGNNIKTGELKPDGFIKRHKERTNIGEIIGGGALALMAGFGIYKGRGHIKNAFNSVKDFAGKTYENLKQKDIANTLKTHAQKAGETLKTGFSTAGVKIKDAGSAVKQKISSLSIGDKIKNCAGKVWNYVTSIPEKISNLAKKIHK